MSATMSAVTLDCADAFKLASFWADVLGRDVDEGATEEFAMIGSDEGPGLTFIQVPEAKAVKNRVHIDLTVDDLAAEVERVVGLGARSLADREEGGIRWTTLTDPEGNEFCLVAGS